MGGSPCSGQRIGENLGWAGVGPSERPILIAVDDAHWCDLPSLRYLAYLAHRLDGLAIGLLVAARPELRGQQDLLRVLAAEPRAVRLRPGPLGDGAVHVLVSQVLGCDADHAFSAACLRSTGGNPFLLRELLAEARAADIAPRATDIGRLDTVAPPTVAHAVLARLARLPDGATALARAAAVLGDGVDPRLAGRLAAVAQALFVSEKTIETHLGSAYRKLGIASRTQLRGALGDR